MPPRSQPSARAPATRAAARRAPGISVKLSALHPRFEAISRERVLAELVPRLLDLARMAKAHDLQFTIDAEEADRLELSLDVIGAVLADPSLRGWDGFGLAVQAYQKRALPVIAWIEDAAAALGSRLTVRLVKGAYWDTEIKRAQERGLADYPVFTRKAMTDLCYMACVKRLLAARERLFPQFATHNALTVASVIEDAGGVEGFEFQRLHGMGEALYEALLAELPDAPAASMRRSAAIAICSPIWCGGCWRTAPTRRSSRSPPTRACRSRRFCAGRKAGSPAPRAARNRKIPLPRDLYQPERRNSAGVEFGERASLDALLAEVRAGTAASSEAAPLIDGVALPGIERAVMSPIDGRAIGVVREGDEAIARAAMAAAAAGFAAWAATPCEERAALARARRRAARRPSRPSCSRCCRTRAARRSTTRSPSCARRSTIAATTPRRRARAWCAQPMPGPTGESNVLRYRGRGVFVCISPWNFPLAIFLGQVSAALVAGNAVVAKPAEQTPLIAARAVALLHEAGVPESALHLVPGDGAVGASLVADPRVAGVVFTGSTEVGRAINRALAAKRGPIVPLIAETGGINAMIVDATALPEQVIDDVMASAFRSAGQRCSALRLLCLQDDVAEPMLDMLERRDARTESRRSARAGNPCRPGDRRRGQGQARKLDRRHGARRPRALPLGRRPGAGPPAEPMWRRR